MATTPTTSTGIFDRFTGFVKSFIPSSTPVATPTPATPAPAVTPAQAPVVAPVQQPVPAPVKKAEEVALERLTTSDLKADLNKLWKEKVTDASTLGKIFGVISYVFNLPSAYAKSLVARTTINELNDAATTLVKAVAARSLAPNEMRANDPNIVAKDIRGQHSVAGKNAIAEGALNDFYRVFAKRTSQLGVSKESEDFGTLAKAAQLMLRKAGEAGRNSFSKSHEQFHLLPRKMETTIAQFSGVAVAAMIEELSGRETLDQIGPDNYKSTVGAIAKIANGQSLANIEADVRQAIKATHSAEMLPLITELRNIDPTSARNVAIKDGIKGALEAEKTAEEANLAAINTELQPIRGNNYGEGEVHAAYVAKETALAEYNLAERAYMTLRFVGAPANVTRRALLGLPLNPSAELSAAHADASAKLATLEAAEAAYAALDQRCQTLLAQRGTVEGKLGQIGRDLSDAQLDIAARNTREKSLRFYVELNNAVSRRNVVERYNAMQAIVNN